MKEEILKRAMFAMPLSKEAKGTGIMAGFDMEEMEEDADENANMEEMPPMARTPQNPEILMNTLRGDMRSVDARYQELAQMVGEEAAMETPPEVLAMLQSQLGAQQQGIGALPQGQEMMPPGAGMPPDPSMMPPGAGMPPDQMGAPQPAPAMPQGGIPMPPGMESAPPFSQGAEAPEGYAVGGLVRGAQFLGDKVGQYGSAANAALGRMFMSPQPTMQRMTGGTPPMNLSVQGREALLQSPAGLITQGTGTKIAPYTTLGPLTAPTFTQGISTAFAQGAERFPRAAQALRNMFPAAGLAAGVTQSYLNNQNQSSALSPEEEASRQGLLSQIPTTGYPAAPMRPGESPRPVMPAVAPPPVAPAAAPPAVVADEVDSDPLGAFMAEKEAAFDKRQLKGTTDFIKKETTKKSKIDRIRDARSEYEPLFAEILGDDKESAKINALLLLSEAGLKLASTAKPTFAMAVADAASGLPRGFAAIAAQERELGVKGKMAALQQAIGDVDAQDKYAQQLQLQVLKGDYDLLKEQAKRGAGNIVLEDGGVGGRNSKTKDGSFLGFSIDPNDPAVTSAIQSRHTLRPTDNPFVSNMGQAPTTVVTDKAARLELGSTLSAHDNSLKSIEIAKNYLPQLYSVGTFFVDKINNLIVPIDPTGIFKPNLNQEAAKSILMTLQNTLSKSIASANNSGRTAVQEQEWARQLTAAIADPTAFFKDRELAAKTLTSIETSIRNARQETMTQLGFEGNDYVMRTPNTGTKNDPFLLSANPAEQKIMFTFLGSTIGKLQDPKAVVYLNMGPLGIKPFTPAELRQKAGLQ